MSNSTCFSPKAPQEGPPLFQHGNIVFQAHHVGWIVTGFFTIVATITSFWLVNKHLQWYTNKREQRYIVRLLFMVPLYAIISFGSYLFWNHSTPLLLIRDAYESTVLSAFFYLLLTYLSPSPDEQKTIFAKVGLSRQADREARRKGEKVRKWMFPLSFIKAKPADGLYFLQMMKWGVLQYCVIRPTTTLAAVILNYFGWYCNDSLSPRWAHVYITVVVSLSVSIAMYCLVQLYVPVAGHLAPHKPLLKLFAVKAVVFLTFWQAVLLSGLSMFGVVKDSQYMTADDINTGLSAILETFEMMLFAFLHIRAFSYKPYRPPYHPTLTDSPPPIPTSRLRSLGHAFDFRETFREIWAGCIYISDRIRGVEPRPDIGARRMVMMEDALGRARLKNVGRERRGRGEKSSVRAVEVKKEVEVDVDVGGERQWLGLGDDYAYGLKYAIRREKSVGLGEAIEKELDKRGVQLRDAGADQGRGATDYVDSERPQGHRQGGQRTSWWRGVYNRLSQSGPDPTDERFTRLSRHNSRSHHHSRNVDHTSLLYEYDDAPPPSIIHAYRASHHSEESRNFGVVTDTRAASGPDMSITQPAIHVQESADILGPLPSSKRPSVPPRSTPSSMPTPLFDRTDSLLGRVFPHGSPAMSSIELGGVPSVSSRSIDNASSQSGAAKLRMMSNTSVLITPGNDPGCALMGSPIPLQIPVGHFDENGLDIMPRSQQPLLLSTTELDHIPPPVPPKSSTRRTDCFPKRHQSPRQSGERSSRSPRSPESASHRASYVSSSHPSSVPCFLPHTAHIASQAQSCNEDGFDAMNLYMAADNARQKPTSPERFAEPDLPAKRYHVTDHTPSPVLRNSLPSRPESNVVSPSYQVSEIYPQRAAVADNGGLVRSTYPRPTIDTRSHRRTSAPVEVARRSVTTPTASRSRTGHQSRHPMDNANNRQLTVPVPLARNS